MNDIAVTRSGRAPPEARDLGALFHPLGADGVYARTGLYEGVVDALAALITDLRPKQADVFRFPPVIPRSTIEASGFVKSFPRLLGCVACLQGGESEILSAVKRLDEDGGAWTEAITPADLVLTPASCYPVYPIAAARGAVPAQGWIFDVGCECFRREPSAHLDRLQSFRMREYVRIGTPEQISAFRADWIERAKAVADQLRLPYAIELATDPFFGRFGQLMAANQMRQALKFELLVPILPDRPATACMSFNYHQDHFGEIWDLRGEAGAVAHTGCVAFGMDRLALAVFAIHGLEIERWPSGVREALKL